MVSTGELTDPWWEEIPTSALWSEVTEILC